MRGTSTGSELPLFVLAHPLREPIGTQGGTAFHFATQGIEEALVRARRAAGSKDIRLSGGAATIRDTGERRGDVRGGTAADGRDRSASCAPYAQRDPRPGGELHRGIGRRVGCGPSERRGHQRTRRLRPGGG